MNNPRGHLTTITVNSRPVEVAGPRLTGLQIKEAAIAAGVSIGLDFLLTEELANGRAKVIGDSELVTVNKNSQFLAVAGDDNS